MVTPRLRVYVAGSDLRSRRVAHGVRDAGLVAFGVKPEVQLVDVLVEPEVADADHVMVVPTAILLEPCPERRIFGDLSDARGVAAAFVPPPVTEGGRA